MRKEIIETGKSVEEAIISACQKLGCERENCEWEIIDLPKKGFLGLKNIPAKVRVSHGTPEPEAAKPAPARQAEAPSAAPVPPQKEQRERRRRPDKDRNRDVRGEPGAKKPEQRPAQQQRRAAQEPEKEAAAFRPEARASSAPVQNEEAAAKAAAAAAYLEGVLARMGLKAKVEPVWEESGVCLTVKGEGLGVVIGRRGETLDALQYLSGLVANRREGDYLRVTVDCGDYRLKRRATLEALARKVAGQVLKSDVSKTLEPMNPFERRIIHATVSGVQGVTSTSIGEEPNRRVVITTPTARNPRKGGGREARRDEGGRERRGSYEHRERGAERHGPGRDRDRDRDRNRDSRGGRARGERTPAYQPAKEPEVLPTEAADQPLYGKIDLD